MTANEDEALRGLVRQAYEATSAESEFDVEAGLRDVMSRAGHSMIAHATGSGKTAEFVRAVGGTTATVVHTFHSEQPYSGTSLNTLVARTLDGGYSCEPGEGRRVSFGRNHHDVHIPLGVDDRRVARECGELTFHDGLWRVRNTGKVPIRLGFRLVLPDGEPLPLGPGYSTLLVEGSPGRVHALELRVVGRDHAIPVARPNDETVVPATWRLTAGERVVLTMLSQRYLLHEPEPRPLSLRTVAASLAELQPEVSWTTKRVEHIVTAVRTRLARDGVPALTKEEVGEPVGDALKRNLIRELLTSATLTPADLDLLRQDRHRVG
ncbi:FHA domain-containing protein [Amycolatopsis sp. lyj-90]|uniref:FHA domain-containing protein n=1 Tax=Amycolatopsis sp. lyj-90 TaxID=2789285 RepID=UPI003978B580